MRVAVVLGTRPEAVKLAPLVLALRERPGCDVSVVSTAQHREMLDQALQLLGIATDVDCDVMRPGQGLSSLAARVLERLAPELARLRPDWLVVQGDTTTTALAALAAFHARIRVAHVEAGLRTGRRDAPFPEEINRRLTAVLADVHFAPTEAARVNLLREGIPVEAIHVTGNTGIDALRLLRERLARDAAFAADVASRLPTLDSARRLVLVTAHRRESFGAGLEGICTALLDATAGRSDVQVVYPVHLNPSVREVVERRLGPITPTGSARCAVTSGALHLIDPVDPACLALLLERSHVVVTDSGGIQEEAASLGRPVLVLRDVTERPEGVAAGVARVVGTDPAVIVPALAQLLDDPAAHARMAVPTAVYGDGHAATRIAALLAP